jgi:hypothetical protein
MQITLDCPIQALPKVAEYMRDIGALVVFDSPSSGHGTVISGSFEFRHDGEFLKVWITEDQCHFPKRMLVGGLRQLVSEAVEAIS